MNWFERYGIVGAYFLLLCVLFCLVLWPETLSKISADQEGILKLVLGFFAVSFLPIGYILCTLSQIIYYQKSKFSRFLLGGNHYIHVNVIKGLDEDMLRQLELSRDEDEPLCEDRLTAIIRLRNSERIKDALEYCSRYNTKRWDVLSINSSIIFSTYLAVFLMFFSFVITLALPLVNIAILDIPFLRFLLMVFSLFLLVRSLLASNKKLGEQIERINREFLEEIIRRQRDEDNL